jgi:hypothetical protein
MEIPNHGVGQAICDDFESTTCIIELFLRPSIFPSLHSY